MDPAASNLAMDLLVQILGTSPVAVVLYVVWRQERADREEERKERRDAQDALVEALRETHALGESTRDAIQSYSVEAKALRKSLDHWLGGVLNGTHRPAAPP